MGTFNASVLILLSPSCTGLSRASTSFLLCRSIRRGWPGHLARRRAAGFCPAMTMVVSSSRRQMLRRGTNCQQMSAIRLWLRRIVEKPLAENPVAAPFLQRNFIEPSGFTGMIDKFEHPVDRDTVALDHRGNANRDHTLCARQRGALMRHQHVAADPGRGGVLLHAGVLGIIALDRAAMIAGNDGRNEFIETGARRHGTFQRIDQSNAGSGI